MADTEVFEKAQEETRGIFCAFFGGIGEPKTGRCYKSILETKQTVPIHKIRLRD